MKNKRIIKSGFQVMTRFKLRTFFMMLGVMIGIAALTLVLSLGKGTKQLLINKVQKIFSAKNIFIAAGGGEMKGGPIGDGATSTFTLDDLKALSLQVPHIVAYDAQQIAPSRSVKHQQNSIDVSIYGATPAGETVWNRSTTRGSYFTQEDMQQYARVALVGPAVVKTLFNGHDPVGTQIRIGVVPFQVIGVLAPIGVDPHGMDRDNEIVIPITTLMRRILNVDFIASAKLEIAEGIDVEQTALQVRDFLRERHHLGPDEADDFTMVTPKKVRQILARMTGVFSLILPLIAAISLLAGGIVVAALMLISVNERTREIGLRKALGARTKDILVQFMAETTAITLTGGFIGFIVGWMGLQILILKMKLPQVVPWEAFLLGMVCSAIVGLAAGVLPARRAAQLEAVETLK